MRKSKKIIAVAAGIVLTFTVISCRNTTSDSSQSFGFITRSSDKLMDGELEFRFVGMNTPNLTEIEDDNYVQKGWHRIDSFEIRDAFKTIQLMGGTVTRTYVFSVKGGLRNPDLPSHIMAPGTYDEGFFKDFDLVLAMANEFKIRLIVPFIDNWNWLGGVPQLAAFRGKNQGDFCTDTVLISDYQNFVRYVLNRTNSYTGVKYKDDPSILAWETGNELGIENAYGNADILDEWTGKMATFIKSIDTNHLVQDGKDCYRYGLSEKQLQNKDVDMLTEHYYWGDYVTACNASREKCKGKKVFYVGEFNSASSTQNLELLQTVVKNGTSGALLWSLRFHTSQGGFYYHDNKTDLANPCFRWPGFTSANTDERTKMKQIREYAYLIRNMDIPGILLPEPPGIIEIKSPHAIRWLGSAGAESYIIERSEDKNGPWVTISDSAKIDDIPFQPFDDTSVEKGRKYYYRFKARNVAGISEESDVVGPVADSSE